MTPPGVPLDEIIVESMDIRKTVAPHIHVTSEDGRMHRAWGESFR